VKESHGHQLSYLTVGLTMLCSPGADMFEMVVSKPALLV
jgi:hypothetical protein